MVLPVRSKNLDENQASRRKRLLQAFQNSIEAIEREPLDQNLPEDEKGRHLAGLLWLKAGLDSFRADPQLHNLNMGGFLKSNGLQELFEAKEIWQLSGVLATPLSRLKNYCTHAGLLLPAALEILHVQYSQEHPSLPPRQIWIPLPGMSAIQE